MEDISIFQFISEVGYYVFFALFIFLILNYYVFKKYFLINNKNVF